MLPEGVLCTGADGGGVGVLTGAEEATAVPPAGVRRVGPSDPADVVSMARNRIDEDFRASGPPATWVGAVSLFLRAAAHFSQRATSTLDGTSSSDSLIPQESQ
jgi:hypothetical protein